MLIASELVQALKSYTVLAVVDHFFIFIRYYPFVHRIKKKINKQTKKKMKKD